MDDFFIIIGCFVGIFICLCLISIPFSLIMLPFVFVYIIWNNKQETNKYKIKVNVYLENSKGNRKTKIICFNNISQAHKGYIIKGIKAKGYKIKEISRFKQN